MTDEARRRARSRRTSALAMVVSTALGTMGAAPAAAAQALLRHDHASASERLPATFRAAAPGVPKDPTVVYEENFENTGSTPALLNKYAGAAPQNESYTADPSWLTGCNGWVLKYGGSENYAPGITSCANETFWDGSRSIARAIGAYINPADPDQNHAVTAFTYRDPGVNKIQFDTVQPIPLHASNRFLTFAVTTAAKNCQAAHPLMKFYLKKGTEEIPTFTKPLDPCTDPRSVTPLNDGVMVLDAPADTPYLFSGDEIGIRMRNGQGSGTGNDHAFDDIRILDVTPSIDKSFSTAAAPSNGTAQLTFTVTNTSDLLTKKGWSFADNLPSGMKIADSPGASTTCTNGAVTAAAGSTNVKLKGDLNSGQTSCTLTVSVTAPKGEYENCAANVTDLVGVNAPGCATIKFVDPRYTISKTSSPASGEPVVPGEKVTYTLTVANPGEVPVDATLTDDLTKVLDDATYNQDMKADAGTVRYGPPKLSWAGTLAPGEQAKITYSVTANDPGTGDGLLTNTVVGDTNSNCFAGTEAGCTTTVGTPTLEIQKTPDRQNAKPGEKVTYTVVATNTGKAEYKNARITDDLTGVLDDAVYNKDAQASSGNVTLDNAKLYWSGDIAAGARVTIVYTVTVNAPATGDNVLKNTVTGPPGSNCPADSTDPKCSATVDVPELEIAKTVDQKSAKPGEKVAYTLTVTNTGKGTYTGATVTDDLTKVIDDASYNKDARASTGSVAYDQPKLTWTSDLAAGETATVTYTVTVKNPISGDKALQNGVSGPPGSNCEPGSTDPKCGSLTDVPELTIAKTADKKSAKPGETVAYTVTITNTGKVAYTGAKVADNLSKVIDDATYNTDVKASSGSASLDNTTLYWTGDLDPGEKATVTYTVTVNTPDKGDYSLENTVTGPPGSDCVDCSTTTPVSDLLVAKSSDAGAVVKPGDKVTYTVAVTNPGKSTYTGATFSDDLAKVLDDAAYNKDVKASGGTTSYDEPKLTWTGDVPAGKTVTVTYSVTVAADPAKLGDGKLDNAVTGGSNCPEGSTDPTCSTHTGDIPTLALSKSLDTAAPLPGDTVTYTVTVTNKSATSPYPGASFTDDLSKVLDDAAYGKDGKADSGEVSYDEPKLTWKGDVPAGGTVTVTYSVKVNDPLTGDQTMTNAVTSNTPGTNCPEGSTDPKCGTTAELPSLKIKKTAGPLRPEPGDKITYTVTVLNDGKADYPGATFTDDLTQVLDDASYNDDAKTDIGEVTHDDPKLTWTGDLAKGATATITYSVTADQLAVRQDEGDGVYVNKVVGGPGSNCGPDSTDPDCRTILPPREYDFGDAPDSYGTTLRKDGAYAEIVSGLRIGAAIEPDTDGQPSTRTDGDAAEDAMTDPVTINQHDPDVSLTIPVTDTTDADAVLAGWIDIDHDGTFGADELATATVTPGATQARLTWHGTDAMPAGTSYLRLRLFGDKASADRAAVRRDTAPVRPTGFGGPGEVEDHRIEVAPAHLEFTKSASPATAKPGDKVTYTVTVTSDSPADYAGATFTDDLTEVLDDAAYNKDVAATAGSVEYTKPKLVWKGTVPAGKPAVVTYSVTVGDPVRGDGALVNAVTGPKDSTCEPGSTDPKCTTTVEVPPGTPIPPPATPDEGTTPPPGQPGTHPGGPNALPDTGASSDTLWAAIGAALTLGAGTLLTVATRRGRRTDG
ncbi:GEVED domain-containing protein [Streptomyces sp. NPDC050738]|uniref:DUF7927 domain-containing protein n=1 Tax=Streptomyces sp. NPDC050738 TaxID=3154744 RepID=UPI003414425E